MVLAFLVHSIVGSVRGAISCIDNAVDVICIGYIHDGYGPERKMRNDSQQLFSFFLDFRDYPFFGYFWGIRQML